MSGESVALVSGGLDSVVALALARDAGPVRLVMFFDYGQRAVHSERASAMGVAGFYGLEFREVDLRWMGKLAPASMRTGASDDAPLSSVDEVWFPNRNGLFINVAAAFAESYGCTTVVCGFNREEAAEFPDNSEAFVLRSNDALSLSTRNGVRVWSPTIGMDKKEMIAAGMRAGAPLSTIWSCYRSGDRMCGTCASCRRLRAALDAVGDDDRPVIEFEV